MEKKVVVAGVPYSSNVGDGVISDCILQIIRRSGLECDAVALDIAGREGYVSGDRTKRVKLLDKLSVLPNWLRKVVIALGLVALYRLRWRKRWLRALDGTQFLLIGGGQLISDVDLNFPIKLYGLVKVAEALKVPVAFVSCGVGEHWSFLGRYLVKRALNSPVVRYVSVRDARSNEVLNDILDGGCKDGRVVRAIVPDPAVCCRELMLSHQVQRESATRVLGLGISSPGLLAYSARSASSGGDEWGDAFRVIIRTALDAGWEVNLFSNGAPEDEEYMDRFLEKFDRSADIVRIPAPIRGKDLVEMISRFDLVVAHRLHANIVAFGLGVPSIGLAWDEKLRSFLRLTGRSAYFVERPLDVTPNFNRLMESALAEGVSESDQLSLRKDVFSGYLKAFEVVRADR